MNHGNMIYKNVELHNVEEVYDIEGSAAVGMRRVPEHVRVQLNDPCQFQMLKPAGAEIRFVVEDGGAEVILSSEEETTATAIIFYGVFQAGEIIRITAGPTKLKLGVPKQLSKLRNNRWEHMPFAPHVCRVMLRGGPIHLHGVEGSGIRPPRPEELPSLRYLAYGTSITHGSAATAPHLCYAQQTARRLGADLINLGSGGSAHCEHALADYIGQRSDWHIASLALSVNMHRFPLDEFAERVTTMVHTVAGSDPSRPVACITLFPFFDDFEETRSGQSGAPAEAYRQKLRDAVASCPSENAHLIEGPELLTDVGGLTPDLLHPADNGMIQMGENLARFFSPWVR